MKKIKLPNTVILVAGGLGAFWISDIINPGFNPIGVMLFMLIPVLIAEILYPQPELEQLLEQTHYHTLKNPDEEVSKEGELLTEAETTETVETETQT
ncbi:MAG: hypothetical protein QM500_05830 [Methylococcales bacterium]